MGLVAAFALGVFVGILLSTVALGRILDKLFSE